MLLSYLAVFGRKLFMCNAEKTGFLVFEHKITTWNFERFNFNVILISRVSITLQNCLFKHVHCTKKAI